MREIIGRDLNLAPTRSEGPSTTCRCVATPLATSHGARHARYPDKIAIIDGDFTLTFAEFDGLVDRAAAALRDNGFGPGDRVALLAHNCWQYAVLAFATARAAVVLVPINFMLTAEEIAFILGHSRVSGFIVEHDLIPTRRGGDAPRRRGDDQGRA